ncbi:Protein phosphatase 2C 56 [Striga hermonthica]|uniref:Protein phosphatase 2C 56 n=1 Tax=Striga hermonthica TaxID=68872 RepID=A0A9N7R6Y9_STRHE|nr:Protein phosphatase 2C 56 [Striga hermonthica]
MKKDLLEQFDGLVQKEDVDLKYKLRLLIVLEYAVLSNECRTLVDERWFHLVEDLEQFNSYPWGNLSYEYTVWAFEALPELGRKFAQTYGSGRLPRMMSWKNILICSLRHCLLIFQDIILGIVEANFDKHVFPVGKNVEDLNVEESEGCRLLPGPPASVGGCHGGDIDCADNKFPPVAPNSVASTAVVALICSTHIIVANCGDSRAVLCRAKVPMPLSVDHRPNSKAECARIEAAGGKVVYWNGYRVSGFLAVSRSIDPEVMFVHRAKEDDCLILASDGLWDVITNEEACDLARKRILLWHKNNAGQDCSRERRPAIDPAAQDAADYLSRLAIRKGSRDNIPVIVNDLRARRKLKRKGLERKL